jgi:type I restriction enzyme S subunit
MRNYNEYKDSGVQWIGQIPGHWKTVRVKALLSERVDKSDTGLEEPLSMSQKYGIIPTKEMDVIPNMASTFIGAKRVFKKDLVFNKLKAHLGVFAISEYDGLVSPDYAVYTPNDRVYLPFMEYMFHTPLYIREFTKRTTGVAAGFMRLYTDGLFAIPFVYPPINEQHSIVSYLDDKCSKLDKMLEGKQKQIELLAELKQRIIADAVTHGVNPDVKMRATNISWLSEIPKHWKEQRMASLFTGEIDVNKNFEFKHAFKFNYGQLVPKNEIGDPEEYRSVYVKYSKIKAGDILINGLNLNYDFVSQRVACASLDGIITSAYVVCRPRTGVNYDYYTYLFKSMDSMKLFHGMGTGIRLTLSFKELKKQMIPIPPQSEQRAIVEFIKCKEAKFDSLTSKLQQEIESIKEYKQRLISDVVTGQIKVC